MRIWHQSLTVLSDLPAYAARLNAYFKKVARPGTEVVIHGLVPGTYSANYPGDDIAYNSLYAMHSLQFIANAWKAQKEGYDAFALCTLPDPMLREIRTILDIPAIGLGETCFLTVPTLGQRFAVLVFLDHLAPCYREQMAAYGVSDRCVGIFTSSFRFKDVMAAFDKPGPVIDLFRADARRLIDAGADVIVPGEALMNLLLASEGVNRIDDVPVVDSLALVVKTAEMRVDLQKLTGLAPSRRGWLHASPRPERVEEVLRFYGLGNFLDS
jgi:Asp/Glu/hydantoin racemase